MRLRQTIRASTLARHTHNGAYAALVLSGSYEEAGDNGRFRVEAGDVLIHDRFEAHVDRFSAAGAVVLNLPLPAAQALTPGAARIANADHIVTTAERDGAEAASLLLSACSKPLSRPDDWPDDLAEALVQRPDVTLSAWAASRSIAPWTLSRGFAQIFGITPEAFRARSRARQAWKLIQTSTEPLAQIAVQLGFADQSHMTRSVRQFTGMTPHAWRNAANEFKTKCLPITKT